VSSKENQKMIYISTGGYKDLAFENTVKELSKFGIVTFELSGGKFSNDALTKLKTLSEIYAISIHNYFPPPKIPFVLNLASFRDDIVHASMSHITYAIDISHSIGAKYYGFHAGYLIDPPVSELGAKITKQVINDRQKALDCFVARASKLAEYAEGKGVKLLVENNVLSKANYKSFGENPLLMVDEDETYEIMSRSHSNLGLLIDVAHLKVSANTLGFSAIDYLKNFYGSVSAYHFSDNLGLEDSNDEITEESWFWPYINKNLDYYSLEVYEKTPNFLKNQLQLASRKLGKHV
jgi:sugar phosphate isomerase/epimerase